MSHVHEPKVHALLAQRDGRLSAQGHARLARHLAACTTCCELERGMRLEAALRAEVLHHTPVVDFAKIERALRAQREASARSRRRMKLVWSAAAALSIAAAVVLAVLRDAPTQGAQQPVASSLRASAPDAPARYLPVRADVTAVRGEVWITRDAQPNAERLRVPGIVGEGDVLSCVASCEAHVRIAQQTAFVLAEGGKVQLVRLREGDTQLGLEHGRIVSQVHPLTGTQRFEVLARGYTVAVRGTHFSVSAGDERLEVAVDEGHVVVTNSQGQDVADLHAGQRFGLGSALESNGPVHLPEALGSDASYATNPSGPRDSDNMEGAQLATLELPALTALDLGHGVRVETLSVRGASFGTAGQLAMRVPVGDVELDVTLADGRTHALQIEVPLSGFRVDEAWWKRALRESAPAAENTLGAAEISVVVQRGMPALERCYELALKQRPDVSGKLTLRISLDRHGRVQRADPRAQHAAVPEQLVSCLRTAVKRWTFPAPGPSGITFDAPIRLTRR